MNATVESRIKYMQELKGRYEDKPVVLFRDLYFYFMYNEDAKTITKELGIANQVSRGGDFLFNYFNTKKLDEYLPILIRRGYRVAIVDEDF